MDQQVTQSMKNDISNDISVLLKQHIFFDYLQSIFIDCFFIFLLGNFMKISELLIDA